MIRLLFLLICAHALCDYPLQGDFLSRGKNRFAPIPGVPWDQCMAAHCLIHAGAVYLLTGSLWLAAFEFTIHSIIDDAKCAGHFGFNVDQALHVACKIAWVAFIWFEVVR